MPHRDEPSEPPVTEEEIRRQLGRILDYGELQASVRRRKMLEYVVEQTLADRTRQLKATSIAMAVFDRGPDFDQQLDPVVRLEARKLRRDLDNYYASAGRYDPIRISIPKGRYIPKFTVSEAERSEVAHRTREPAGPSLSASRGRGVFGPRTALLTVAGLACAVAVFSWAEQIGAIAPAPPDLPTTGAQVFIEPFETRTSDPDALETLVAEGLANEIAGALIRFPDLSIHLIPDDEGSEIPPAMIGREREHESFMVRGNLWREENDMLIRAELIRHENLEVLWSERYVEGADGKSITEIQDTISAEIASVVGQQYGHVLQSLRADNLSDQGDPSLRGFACVASAQIYRRTYNRNEYQAARDCLEATVLEDPDYVRAWSMLAYLRNDGARFGHDRERSREAAINLAREAATRAIDLDPYDTDALQAMSHIEQYARNLDRAIDFASDAVQVNPNDPSVLANLSLRLAVAGRFSEAVPVMQRAVDRSVAPPPFYFYVFAASHLMKTEWPEMLAAAERAAVDGWSLWQLMLAIAHNELSNEYSAREALDKMAALDPVLAENPRTWLEAHNYNAPFVDAVLEGLARAQAVQRK